MCGHTEVPSPEPGKPFDPQPLPRVLVVDIMPCVLLILPLRALLTEGCRVPVRSSAFKWLP